MNWSKKALERWLGRLLSMDFLVVFSLCVFALAAWWPTRYLPYIGETAIFNINAAKYLQSIGFSKISLADFGTFQPPGFALLVAGGWKIFGESILATHGLVLPFFALLMVSTFFITKKVLGPAEGVVVSFLIGVVPIMMAGVGMVSKEIVVASLGLTSICLWLYEQDMLAMVLLGVSMFISYLTIPYWAVLVYMWFKKREKSDYRLVLFPALVGLVWIFYHYFSASWLLTPSDRTQQYDLVKMFTFGRFVLTKELIGHGLWVAILPGIGSLLWLFKVDGLDKEIKTVIEALLIGYFVKLCYAAVMGLYEERLAIISVPLILMASFISLITLTRKYLGKDNFWLVMAASVMASIVFIASWRGSTEPVNDYNIYQYGDLGYQDLIMIGRLAAGYLQGYDTGIRIYGGYPEVYQLTEPYQGYVDRPLDFHFCRDFAFDGSVMQIVYIHPYHVSQMQCNQLMDEYTMVPLQRFEANGKWLDLFRVTATASAKLK